MLLLAAGCGGSEATTSGGSRSDDGAETSTSAATLNEDTTDTEVSVSDVDDGSARDAAPSDTEPAPDGEDGGASGPTECGPYYDAPLCVLPPPPGMEDSDFTDLADDWRSRMGEYGLVTVNDELNIQWAISLIDSPSSHCDPQPVIEVTHDEVLTIRGDPAGRYCTSLAPSDYPVAPEQHWFWSAGGETWHLTLKKLHPIRSGIVEAFDRDEIIQVVNSWPER